MLNNWWDKKTIFSLVVVILIAIGVWVIVSKDNTSLEKEDSSYIASGTLYRTTLAQEKAEELSSFLESSLEESYLPEELNLISTTAKDGTKEFRGTWLASDNKLLSVLYVLDNRERISLYMRVWRMHEKPGLDNSVANTLSEEIFNEDFIGKVGKVECTEKTLAGNPPITECAKVQKQSGGEILGIALYSPVSIEELGSDGAVVSGCLIPKENTATYTARTCI